MDMMQIWIQPDPLKTGDLQLAEVPINQTLHEISGTSQIEAWVDGLPVDAYYIENTIITNNQMVIISPIPQGSTEIWRNIATIALVITAAVLAPVIAGLAGLGAVGASLLTGVISAGIIWGGSALINYFLPMPTAEGQESFNRLSAITGQQNKVGAYVPIPRLYGRLRYFPHIPMTAIPYTELLGGDQYIRMYLCLGYGPLSIGGVIVGLGRNVITQDTILAGAPITIGETDILEYDGVEYQIGRHDQISLYSNEVIEMSPGWETSHPDPVDGWNTDGENSVHTTSAEAIEISIDVWGSLYSVNSDGDTTNAKVDFKVEYCPTGTDAWIVYDNSWIISCTKRETVRQGIKWTVPKGQYDIRLTRIRTYHADTEGATNSMTWASLRTIRDTKPFQVDNTIVLALRIKATDQLQGSLNNVAVEATAVLPVWNGTSWVEQATRNPAWSFVDVLTGFASRRPIDKSKIDTTSLLAWANQTESDGDYFDLIYDDSATVIDRINSITATGRASWGLRDDAKISVIIDDPSPTPKMIISPRNSSGFSYTLSTLDIPHAFRVKFVDDTTWENTERVVYDDGYDKTNATLFKEMEAIGCTNPEQAWRLGRFHLAQMRMRPESYSFSQGLQYLHYSRGDLLQIQHDVIMVGLASGRITSVEVTPTHLAITTDIMLYMESGTTYGIKILKDDGTVITSEVLNETSGTPEYMLVDTTIDIEADDLFVFGELGKETIDVKVVSITPSDEYSANIMCIPAALDILDALSGIIPAFDPVLTHPIDITKLPLPVPTITRVVSDESVIQTNPDGTVQIRILVETSVGAFLGWNQSVQLRYRASLGSTNWILLPPDQLTAHFIDNVLSGVTYDIQVRSVNATLVSAWSLVTEHTVAGQFVKSMTVIDKQLPADIDGVILSYDGSGTQININEGSTPLSYETGLVAGSFMVGTPIVTPAEKITVGAISGVGTDNCTVADYSGMDADTDVVVSTYPITAKRLNGVEVSFTLKQTISKAKEGATGPIGEDGDDAKVITVLSTSDTLPITSRGIPKIALIKFTAQLQNMTITVAGDITWVCSDTNVTLTPVSGDIYSVALDTSEVLDDSFTVTATVNAIVGQKSVSKVQDGVPAPWNFRGVTTLPTETPVGPLVAGDYFLASTTWGSGGDLSFDGVNDYIALPTSAILGSVTSLTFELNFTPSDITQGYIFSFDSASDWFEILSTGLIRFGLRNTDTTRIYFDSTTVLNVDQQYHIAGVWNGTTMELFIDGVSENTGSLAGTINDSTLLKAIGREAFNGSTYASGKISDVRVWNIARTQQEIQANMGTTIATPTTGL